MLSLVIGPRLANKLVCQPNQMVSACENPAKNTVPAQLPSHGHLMKMTDLDEVVLFGSSRKQLQVHGANPFLPEHTTAVAHSTIGDQAAQVVVTTL